MSETQQTPSDKLWSEIKDKRLEMFALPPQPVTSLVKRDHVEPSKLYLIPSASSVLPALEAALGPKFGLEIQGKWIVVSKP